MRRNTKQITTLRILLILQISITSIMVYASRADAERFWSNEWPQIPLPEYLSTPLVLLAWGISFTFPIVFNSWLLAIEYRPCWRFAITSISITLSVLVLLASLNMVA